MPDSLASWHPFIVHFAVALTIASAMFDILDFFFRNPNFERTGLYLMFPAVPFLVAAVFTGNFAEIHFAGSGKASVIDQHKTYANIALWVFTGATFWRIFLHTKRRYFGLRKIAYVFIVTLAAVSVFLAAMKGGKIRHGSEQPISRIYDQTSSSR